MKLDKFFIACESAHRVRAVATIESIAMEVFLLWLDELDDVACVMRAVWRSIAGFLTAVALFAATVYSLVQMPLFAAGLLIVSLLAFSMLHVRRHYQFLQASPPAE